MYKNYPFLLFRSPALLRAQNVSRRPRRPQRTLGEVRVSCSTQTFRAIAFGFSCCSFGVYSPRLWFQVLLSKSSRPRLRFHLYFPPAIAPSPPLGLN